MTTTLRERMERAATLGLACVMLAVVGCDSDVADTAAGENATVTKTAAATGAPEDLDALYARLKPAPMERTPFVQPVDQPNMPPIRFDPPVLQYGILAPKEIGSGDVTIYNESDQPVELADFRVSCHCTHTDLTRGVIPANGSKTFSVITEPKSGLGDKLVKIRMLFRGWNEQLIDYEVRCTVATPLRIEPSFLGASQRNSDGSFSEIPSGEVWIEAADKKPFTIHRAGGFEPEYIDFDPAADEPRWFYKLRWDVSKYRKTGEEIPWYWLVETDRDDVPVLEFRVRHQETLPTARPKSFMLEDQGVVFGELKPGDTFEFPVRALYLRSLPPTPHPLELTTNSSQYGLRVVGVEDPEGLRRFYKVVMTVRQAREDPLINDVVTATIGGETLPFRLMGRIVDE